MGRGRGGRGRRGAHGDKLTAFRDVPSCCTSGGRSGPARFTEPARISSSIPRGFYFPNRLGDSALRALVRIGRASPITEQNMVFMLAALVGGCLSTMTPTRTAAPQLQLREIFSAGERNVHGLSVVAFRIPGFVSANGTLIVLAEVGDERAAPFQPNPPCSLCYACSVAPMTRRCSTLCRSFGRSGGDENLI